MLLAIIDLAQWLAPPSRRRAWRRQWRADIWHEWRWTGRQSSPAVRATLVGRTAGAVRHAFWLRLHVRKIEMLTQDLRYGWRLLLRKPGFTAVAVLTLGVGIGAAITIFSLFDDIVLRVSALPTVEAAAVSTRAPLDRSTPVIRVSARDPRLFAMSAIAVLIVSAIACYLPARRAASVDPLRSATTGLNRPAFCFATQVYGSTGARTFNTRQDDGRRHLCAPYLRRTTT